METIKKVGYLIVVGLIIMLILAATGGNNIPTDMSFGIGALIALIGIHLLHGRQELISLCSTPMARTGLVDTSITVHLS